jgi:hypothetical protein
MLLNLSLAALVPLLTTLTLAQSDGPKAEARRAYDRGVTEYNLGRFDRAIAEFERAYELDPAPMLLYNLAQAERRKGNLRRAVFLYERFVTQAPTAENASNARRHIQELTAAIRAEEAKPAATVEPPAPPVPVSEPEDAPSLEAPQIDRQARVPAVVAIPPAPAPRLMVGVEIGLSRLDFGREDLRQALAVPIGVTGQYRFRVGSTTMAAGLAVTGSRFHETDRAEARRALHLFGVLASFGVGWSLGDRFMLGPELAAGMMWWSGLESGTRFTVDGAGSSGGPVPLPTLRLGVPVEVAVSRTVLLAIHPTVAIARPGSGLRASIDRVIQLGISAGAGVRF